MLRHRPKGDKNNNKHQRSDSMEDSGINIDHFHEPCTSREPYAYSNGTLPTAEPSSRSHLRSNQAIYVVKNCGIPLQTGKKYLETKLLTGEKLYLVVDIKSKVKDVIKFVCEQLGLSDKKLFGLSVLVESEHRFLDLDQKLVKIAPKSWKETSGWGTDPAGNPTVILYLRVQIFVDFISVINCPVSLLHYYLQLRENTRIYWSDVNSVPEERCWEVAALALQADFSDYLPSKHQTDYFRPESYFPLWVINSRGMDYISRNMPPMHLDLRGMSGSEAMTKFCREVSRYPNPTNVHYYGARKLKSDREENVVMGITTAGIEMLEVLPNGRKEHVFFFRWPTIAKLSFERRKFTLLSMEGKKKLIFFTSSDEKSRYILQFCRRVHQQTMSLQAEFMEAKKQELNERKHFRESYICTDKFEKEWYKDHGHYPETFLSGSLPRHSMMLDTSLINGGSSRLQFGQFVLNSDGSLNVNRLGQRVSMVSDASSNTTSGIVSDRQHTHDDSEAEQDIDLELSVPNTVDSSPMVSQLCLSSSQENYGNIFSSEELLYSSRVNEFANHHSSMPNHVIENHAHFYNLGRPSETPPPLSEKTLTEDDRSIGTTTNYSEKLATEDEDSDHVVLSEKRKKSTESDYRLGELARKAEATISDSLTNLMANRSMDRSILDSSMDSIGSSSTANFGRFAAKTHRVMVESPSSRESSLRGRKVDISELRQKTLNSSFGSPKLKHMGMDYPLVFSSTTPETAIITSTSATQTGESEKTSAKAMKTLATQTSSSYSPCYRPKKDICDNRNPLSTPESSENGRKKVESASQANLDEESAPAVRSRSYRIVATQKSFSSETETVVKVTAPMPNLTENNGGMSRNTSMPKIGISSLSSHGQSPIRVSPSNQTMAMEYGANLESPDHRKVSHPLLTETNSVVTYNYENIDGPNAPPYFSLTSNAVSSSVLPNNSTSLQNIPNGLLKEPPNYQQAVRSRANKSGTKRRTTVANGIDEELMSQIMAAQPSTSLHQAVSEPWLAQQQMSAATPLTSYETSLLAASLANQQAPCSHVSQGRSASTNQIAGIFAGNYQSSKNWPINEQFHQPVHSNHGFAALTTSSGIYSKYNAGQPGARAAKAGGISNLSGRGLRMLSNGLSRVRSMPDHTRSDLYRQHFQQGRFFHDEEAVRQFAGPPSYQEAVISLEQKNRLHEIPQSALANHSERIMPHQNLSQRNSLDLDSLTSNEMRRRSSFPNKKEDIPEKEPNLAHLNQALKTSGQNLPFLKALFRDSAAVRGYQGSPLATPTEGTPSPASTFGRRTRRPPDLSLAPGGLGSDGSPVASPSGSGRPSSWHEQGLDFTFDPYTLSPGSPLIRSLYYSETPVERDYQGQESFSGHGYVGYQDAGRFASTPNLAGTNGMVFNLPPPPAYSNCSRVAPPVGAALYSPSKLRQPVTTAYDR